MSSLPLCSVSASAELGSDNEQIAPIVFAVMITYLVAFIAVTCTVGLAHAAKLQRPLTLSRSSRLSASKQLKSSTRAGIECPVCTPANTGSIPEAISETSSLAASLRHPGVWYTINDSPKTLRLFALRPSGEILSTFDLTGVEIPEKLAFGSRNTGDSEAVVVGPCVPGNSDARSCIYVGDIGQNCARPHKGCAWMRPDGLASIMRFPEPEEVHLNHNAATLPGQRFWFKFPEGDGPYDAETLLMTKEGDLFLVTKVMEGSSDLYQLPQLTPDETVVAEHRAIVREPPAGSAMFTDGSLQYNGSSIVGVTLATMTHAWYYPMNAGESLSSALAESPCPALQIDRSHQPQVEAVEWESSHNAFLLCGEIAGSGIVRVECQF